jgi:hypothetical protein
VGGQLTHQITDSPPADLILATPAETIEATPDIGQPADPIVQMQQQELQIKQAEQQRKVQKDAIDAQLKQEQMQIERQRITTQAQTEMAKTAVQVQQDNEKAKIEILKQEKELHAKGVDNAFKHAYAAVQSKKEKPTKGD